MTDPVIAQDPTPLIVTSDMKFRFKKDKMDNQRPSFELKVALPSFDGIVTILQNGGKGLELLQEYMASAVRDALSNDVGEDETFNQETYNTATITYKTKDAEGKEIEVTVPKYSWDGIANAPKEDRRKIDKTVVEAWAADYIEVMASVTKKAKEAITLAAEVFAKRLSPAKTNKPVLEKLKQNLAIWMENTKKGEEFEEWVEVLNNKLDTYIKAKNPELLVENL